jgi:hypothetical protein
MGIVYKIKLAYPGAAVPLLQPSNLDQARQVHANSSVKKSFKKVKLYKRNKLTAKNKSFLKSLGFKVLRNGKP